MQFSNYHTHCVFCDGSSPPEEYVKEAIRQRMDVLGFSSHAPVPFENAWSIKPGKIIDYCNCITGLKQQFKEDIELLLALEIDYIPGVSSDFERFRTLHKLDYMIGSVHLVKRNENMWFIDGPEEGYIKGIKEVFDGNVRLAVESFFLQQQEMIISEKPDIIGHLDKVKMHNKGLFFSEDEDWYKQAVEKLLHVIARAGTIVEVNTRGIYKGRTDSFFPSEKILSKCVDLNIPVVISSDAHQPKELTLNFVEALNALKNIGFSEIKKFSKGSWTSVSIV